MEEDIKYLKELTNFLVEEVMSQKLALKKLHCRTEEEFEEIKNSFEVEFLSRVDKKQLLK